MVGTGEEKTSRKSAKDAKDAKGRRIFTTLKRRYTEDTEEYKRRENSDVFPLPLCPLRPPREVFFLFFPPCPPWYSEFPSVVNSSSSLFPYSPVPNPQSLVPSP